VASTARCEVGERDEGVERTGVYVPQWNTGRTWRIGAGTRCALVDDVGGELLGRFTVAGGRQEEGLRPSSCDYRRDTAGYPSSSGITGTREPLVAVHRRREFRSACRDRRIDRRTVRVRAEPP